MNAPLITEMNKTLSISIESKRLQKTFPELLKENL